MTSAHVTLTGRAIAWGMIGSEIGWHGRKASIRRPRVRRRGVAELDLPSWTAVQKADLLSRWAFNQMLIGVAMRKYARSIRLQDGDLAGQAGQTRHDEVLGITTFRCAEHDEVEGTGLDLLVIQIDGLHVCDHVLVGDIGIDEIESLMAVVRQVCRNVKRWRDARMALR